MSELNEKTLVLVAEDDASNYRLSEILLKSNYNIIHAWDGLEAVKLCEESLPKIVLMDINMPNMNGYEALDQIKEKYPDLPVVAVTAYAMSDDEDKILDAGFDGYLAKPININTFEKIIERYL